MKLQQTIIALSLASSFLCMGMNKKTQAIEADFVKQFGYPIPTEYNLTERRKEQLAQKRQETGKKKEEAQNKITSNTSYAQNTEEALNMLCLRFNAQSPAPRHVKSALRRESFNQRINILHYNINENVRCTYIRKTDELKIITNNGQPSYC
ncbi:MAG TPA: hypothetical protein VKR54_01745 [Candidatus Babeliales bacterium]|jgi:hypothetical protein|nr:hypothetical protein [Candidatus Babeliales bacterium]